MPPPRARIRKAADGWTVTRPRTGFGPDEHRSGFSSRDAAQRWLDSTISRAGLAHPVSVEASHWPDDAIAPVPGWSPTWDEADDMAR
jgi:hypothetical protein